MINLDSYEQVILSIEENSEVLLCVNGSKDVYTPYQYDDGSWDMKALYVDNTIYGLSCKNLKELKYRLLADYASGIITMAYI